MKPIDLSGLIKGLMVVIGIALALGKLDDLKRWAIHEAFPSGAEMPSVYMNGKDYRNTR